MPEEATLLQPCYVQSSAVVCICQSAGADTTALHSSTIHLNQQVCSTKVSCLCEAHMLLHFLCPLLQQPTIHKLVYLRPEAD